MHYRYHTCTPRPQAVNRHLRLPYPGPISLDTAHIRLGTVWVKNQKKVDDAVVFGLRGMHNHTHLGHVMGYVGIGEVFRWFGAFNRVRGPQRGVREPVVPYWHYPTTGVNPRSGLVNNVNTALVDPDRGSKYA